ncbi:hypothetical protein D4764_14G0005620 [Takifugu flavidus]|uniref:Uncharacterized protein n=1 Tax=Takifugu flavidus TaxID=433684 RepID=A0A5C6P6I9_9TELE|nr:hypothetical protein D4764_14G0005620 [Takifugu flavidus]
MRIATPARRLSPSATPEWYVAVFEPLRYATIMTPARLHTCCSLAWLAAVLSIGVLFAFHVDVQLCGNIIRQVYISNRGIMDLACSPTHINNIYVHPAVNPGIYGLVSKELRASIIKQLSTKAHK